ncbi:MAG TPA: PQQ-binding-like beta-propeller repeat protein, partial [Gemmataceae bacterium]|nr:PQQ-binding-like beta-propeller repeat protein [Gemmataceae bacterium]
GELTRRKPIRVWPGVAIVILQLLFRFVLPVVSPDQMFIGIMAGPLGAVAVVLWWLFFSRARWFERLGAVVLMVAALFATKQFVDVSLATGAMGYLFFFLAIPGLSVAFVVWAVATRDLPDGVRRVTMAATIILACGAWTLAKTGGFTASSFHNDLHWRWAKTAEERLLAETAHEPAALPVAPVAVPAAPVVPAKLATAPATIPSVTATAETGAGWPGFRGPHRDDIVQGVRIETDWSKTPPVQLWRRPIGPGWSSFAVNGNLIYTQEQRGPDEVVACYDATSGKPVWIHKDAVRFWESNGGPGPRGTPTLYNGRAYTFGATGMLNALDARTGAVVWKHNAAADTGMKTPQWGFASSPLVVDDQVIAATAGQLVAYDVATGARRWTGPAHGVSYSSPQLATIDGVPQVLLLSEAGLTSVALADGTLLWEHAWPGYPIVQPALTSDGDILISVTDSSGTRRLGAAHGAGGWTVAERWTSMGLKPYFNDFVVHNGHAFGFDGSILSCIDLKDGKRVWKGGRYGNGQLVLLADQDVLLVLSEEGELALVSATPDQFKELARLPAIEGKTWNHPVVAGDLLLVRNGQEMAAFRLALAGR